MSTANESVVRAYYDAVDRGDIERVLDIFAADAIYDRPGYNTMQGREQLQKFYCGGRVLVGGKHVLEVIVSDGERVSCYGRYLGRNRSGASIDILFADFHRVIAQRIAERRTFFFMPAV